MGAVTPAAFSTSYLRITPTTVEIGEEVTMSILVTNTGDVTGTYIVLLEIGGVVDTKAGTKEIQVPGGESREATFTTSRDTAGTCTVTANGLYRALKVQAPLPPPPPPPPVTPPPVKPVDW